MRSLKITERITVNESDSFKAYLNDVRKIDLFESAEIESECAKKAFNGDERAVEELVKRNLRFVISVAKQYSNNNAPLEDLVNEGNAGLLEAARRFNPSSGNKFISYAVWYVRKDIMNYLSKQTRIIRPPINKINSMVDFNNKISRIKQDLGREVSIEDLLGNVEGYSDNSIYDMFNMGTSNITSLDVQLNDGDGGTLYDVLESPEALPTDHIISNETNNTTLDLILDCLDYRGKRIIKMYYGIGYDSPMNLADISNEVGLTREGVRQIKLKSLRIVRNNARKLGINLSMF